MGVLSSSVVIAVECGHKLWTYWVKRYAGFL